MGFLGGGGNPVSSTVSSVIGGKQLGAAAPPFQPGAGGLGNLLGSGGALESLNQPPITNQLQSLIASAPASEAAPAATVGPPGNPAAVGPPESRAGGQEQPGFLNRFFGATDETLQSPSKVIGLGLLNQLAPGAGLAGIALSGLLGARRQ